MEGGRAVAWFAMHINFSKSPSLTAYLKIRGKDKLKKKPWYVVVMILQLKKKKKNHHKDIIWFHSKEDMKYNRQFS